jgi:hypothetical protein
MKINKIFISALTQKSFHVNSENTPKIRPQGWSWIWKRSCPWMVFLLIMTLPFQTKSQWLSAYTRNDSYLQLIHENDKRLSISQLFANPAKYHQQIIHVRGQVTRLELHLDETKYFIDFVFFLKDGEERVLVFGRHDRTKGDIQLTSGHIVEVQGRFWKERMAHGHRFTNNLEAHHVRFYPPRNPDHAQAFSAHKDPLICLKRQEWASPI